MRETGWKLVKDQSGEELMWCDQLLDLDQIVIDSWT